jgi:manganese/zinc/iron transport system permease protein
MNLLALISWDSLVELWRTLTYQLPQGNRIPVVMRGATILGLACGIVGGFLLLRKRSLVADALSHAALPGVCLGFLFAVWINSMQRFGIEPRSLAILLPGAAIFGMLGVGCVHLITRIPRIKEDAAIGVVLSVFFAIGVVLLSVIQRLDVGNTAGLNQFIFGQAATMSVTDANIIAIAAAIVTLMGIVAYKELSLLSFDQQFASSLGWSALALDGLLLIMVTLLTVIGLPAVGAILMVALLIIPPAAARFWTDRLWAMIVLSAVIGAIACHVGVASSAAFDVEGSPLPTGPAIVVACGSLFLISMLAAPKRGLISSFVQHLNLRRTISRQHLLRAMYELREIKGNIDSPVTLNDLLRRRSWTQHELMKEIHRAIRRDETARAADGFLLTSRGKDAAARIVRTHRMWEHFLTTQADIAPSHVDRAADDIEHVLSEDLIRDLERELRAQGALAEGEFVPRSPHVLSVAGRPR